jgi:hypothetical protein
MATPFALLQGTDAQPVNFGGLSIGSPMRIYFKKYYIEKKRN